MMTPVPHLDTMLSQNGYREKYLVHQFLVPFLPSFTS